jgi:hypothetical protein
VTSASTRKLALDLADATSRAAIRQAAATPTVRGADWRLATVDTVGSDGTITTDDGVTARRTEHYLDPGVGDLVVITQSSSGNWLALGRLGAGSGSAWTTYTPTWSTTGTAPALVNGSLHGEYTLRGDECHVVINLVMGSSTTYGTGQFRWLMPLTAASLPHASMHWTGSAIATDPGGGYYAGAARLFGGSDHLMAVSPTTATGATPSEWNSARPFTWANADYLSLDITYRIA